MKFTRKSGKGKLCFLLAILVVWSALSLAACTGANVNSQEGADKSKASSEAATSEAATSAAWQEKMNLSTQDASEGNEEEEKDAPEADSGSDEAAKEADSSQAEPEKEEEETEEEFWEYENERLGYSIRFPQDAEEIMTVESYETADYFEYKKAAEEGYGGVLFCIQYMDPKYAETEMEYMENPKILYEGETYSIVYGETLGFEYDPLSREQANGYLDLRDMSKEALSTFEVTDEKSFNEVTHYELEVTEKTREGTKKDSDGEDIMTMSLSELQVDTRGLKEYDDLNETLKTLADEEEDSFNAFSDDSEGSFSIENEMGLSNQDLFSFLSTRTLDLGGAHPSVTYEGHTFWSKYGGDEVTSGMLIRDANKLATAVIKELKKDKYSDSYAKGWEDYITDVCTALAEAYVEIGEEEKEILPVWWLDKEGLNLLFQTGKARKMFNIIGIDSLTCSIPYKDYPDVFIPGGAFDIGEPETLNVSTAEELLSAIGTNKTVILSSGTYDLSDLTKEAKKHRLSMPYDEVEEIGCFRMDEDWLELYPNVASGYEGLVIDSVYSLTLSADGEVEIVTDDPHNDALIFNNCQDIKIEGITFGHDVEPGTCSGDCIGLINSHNIILDSLNLFGCGAYGIEAIGCSEVNVTKTYIHDCTYGLVSMKDCWDFVFMDSSFRMTDGYILLDIYSSGQILFKKCDFENNTGAFFPTYEEWTGISFEDCRFSENERKFIDNHMDYIDFIENGGRG